jgi:predicted ferric reductase
MHPEGHPGFLLSPGQFGWLTVQGSPFKITGHLFSLSSSAEVTDGCVEMSIRNLGDFTSAIRKVPVEQRSTSTGRTARSPSAIRRTCTCLIAGGVGITPMMSMPRTLADRSDTRPVILHYGSRDWETITFREELEALKARLNLTVRP